MPAFYRRRIQQVLVHVAALQRRIHKTDPGKFEIPHEVQRAYHHFGGAFDPGEARAFRLEELGGEHHAQHGSNVVAGAEIFGLQRGDGLRIRWRSILPRRHRHVVGYEEVVEMPTDESRRRGLAADDFNDVVAVEVARFSQECFRPGVVIFRIVAKQPGGFAVGDARYVVVVNRPPGEGSGGLLHVVFRVVGLAVHPHAHGEQFQQFPPPVLVDRVSVIEIVVQPENHCRVAGQPAQQLLETAQTVLPEHVDLIEHRFLVQHFSQSGGEHAVPEQGDFLLEGSRAGVAVHAVNRFGQRALDVAAFLPVDVVPLDDVFFQRRPVLRMQQPLDRSLKAPRAIGIEFGRRGAESGPAQQVSHQGALGVHVHVFTRKVRRLTYACILCLGRSDEHPSGQSLKDRRSSYHSGRGRPFADP